MTTTFATRASLQPLLNLFRLAGKELPSEDSDMGRAVEILQTICQFHDHEIPDAGDIADEMEAKLLGYGWEIFRGNAACSPYAIKRDGSNNEIDDIHHEHNELYCVLAMAYETQGIEFDDASDIFDALDEIETNIGEDDFTVEFDGAEYRLIKEDEDTIWPIYRDEIQSTVEECYSDVLKLDKIPPFIAVSVDWEQTAKNAYADGYGHQFSGYDGSEEQAAGYYIFRTN